MLDEFFDLYKFIVFILSLLILLVLLCKMILYFGVEELVSINRLFLLILLIFVLIVF